MSSVSDVCSGSAHSKGVTCGSELPGLTFLLLVWHWLVGDVYSYSLCLTFLYFGLWAIKLIINGLNCFILSPPHPFLFSNSSKTFSLWITVPDILVPFDLSFYKHWPQPGVAVYICTPSTREAEAGGPWVGGWPRLHSKTLNNKQKHQKPETHELVHWVSKFSSKTFNKSFVNG